MDKNIGWRARLGVLMNENGGPWGNRGGGSGDGPGENGPRNPWNLPPGGGKRPKGGGRGPSALDEFLRRMRDMGGGNMPNGDQTRMIRNGVIALIILWALLTCFHRIGPQQAGVITRFGSYVGQLSPGIGFTLPAPIDRVQIVDIQAINRIDVPEGKRENLVLTGDQNIVDLAYSVRWNVRDAQDFLFQLAEPEETIKEVAESAMREVLSNVALNDASGGKQGQIQQQVAQRMQTLLNQYRAGVNIQGVAIKQANPPEAVNDAFKAVTVAQQNRQANINNANAYAQQIGSRAQGEASSFDKVYEQYRLAPEVTRRRMYYETMEQVLSNVDKTIVEPNAIAPYLPLARGRPQVSVEEPAR